MAISKGLADSTVIAKAVYSSRYDEGQAEVVACDEAEEDDDEDLIADDEDESGEGELWDMPLTFDW